MAERHVTNEPRVKLAEAIPAQTMTKIAEAYFGLEDGVIKNIKADHPGDAEAQSREMIKKMAVQKSR